MAEINLNQLRPRNHTLVIGDDTYALPGRFPVEYTVRITQWFEARDTMEGVADFQASLAEGHAIVDDLLRLADNPSLNGGSVARQAGLTHEDLVVIFGTLISGGNAQGIAEALTEALADPAVGLETDDASEGGVPPTRSEPGKETRAVPRSRSARRSPTRSSG